MGTFSKCLPSFIYQILGLHILVNQKLFCEAQIAVTNFRCVTSCMFHQTPSLCEVYVSILQWPFMTWQSSCFSSVGKVAVRTVISIPLFESSGTRSIITPIPRSSGHLWTVDEILLLTFTINRAINYTTTTITSSLIGCYKSIIWIMV